MLASIEKWIIELLPTNDPKEKAKRVEKKKKKIILKRQKKFQENEIIQTWKIGIGSEMPKKGKDIFEIHNITRRNVWMEENFIFNLIKSRFPDEVFHPANQYALKWQPPGSYFQVIVPLTDPVLQENAVLMINKLKPSIRKKVVFLFAPIDPSMNMFAPRVHPASLVSYRTKNDVLRKLSNYYLEARITLEELQQIFACDYEVWKSALYNYLPEDEQVYHTYLNEKPDIDKLNKPLHKAYYDGDITIEQYEDMKYPDRKKKKEVESMDYPIPFEGNDCIICGGEKKGAIRCYTCDNMVCVQCVIDVFHTTKEHKGQSFLLMHHKYCMKLGELPQISLEIMPEEAYLRQFRQETRQAVLKKLIPEFQPDYDDNAPLDEIIDEEELRLQQLREKLERERLEAERERLLRENPPILQEYRQQFIERIKRYERYMKDVSEYTEKILDTSHTEQFIARNMRLKRETIIKIQKNIYAPYRSLLDRVNELELPGDFQPQLVKEIGDTLSIIDKLVEDNEDLLINSSLGSLEEGSLESSMVSQHY
eukprot:gene14098-15584_t